MLEQLRNVYQEEVKNAFKVTSKDLNDFGWEFDFNNRKSCVGLCNYVKKTIYLSKPFALINTIEMSRQTIKHEIAHALHFGDGHGRQWKATYIALGGNGKVVASVGVDTNMIDFKYVVVDSTTNTIIDGYHRKPKKDFSQCFLIGRKVVTIGKLKIMLAHEYNG